MGRYKLTVIENFFDALQVRKIRNECRYYMTRSQSYINPLQQMLWYLRVYKKENEKNIMWCYLFQVSGRNCGYALVKKVKGNYWITGGLYKSERGKGFGRKLFNSILSEFHDKNIFLEVLSSNLKAKNLYKKLGFGEIKKSAKRGIITMAYVKK